MSVTNDLGISLAENRTFRAFVLLYALMSVLILGLMGSIYYIYKKDQMLSSHRLSMQLQSESYIPRLKRWMQGDDTEFPEDLAYRTGLYDQYYNPIRTNLVESHIEWKKDMAISGDQVQFVIPLASYEVGTQFLVMETEDDGLWRWDFFYVLIGVGIPLMLVLLAIGYVLARLFLRPMKEAMTLLDNFIKDTTHELNTPVAAILNNVESLELSTIDDKNAKKINRISIAAKTISTIYDDLTYLILNHALAMKDEPLDLKAMIEERVEYFKTRCDQKKIAIITELDDDVYLLADRNRIIRVIDNLLSNAIKYNRIGGSITIRLDMSVLRISDTGRGIAHEKVEQIFERYQRVDKSVGGFGIGLNIVAMIANNYGIDIAVDSREGEGTAIELRWPKDLLISSR